MMIPNPVRVTISVSVFALVVAAALTLAFGHRQDATDRDARSALAGPSTQSGTQASPEPSGSTPQLALLPGMPSNNTPGDIYAADRPDALSRTVEHDPYRIYVPNNGSNTVSVIDPYTYRVIRTVRVPASPQHVVPSYDLRTLYVNSDNGNALTPINPLTGAFGKPLSITDPYNLYFTPDGKYAVVMAEAEHLIDFRDAHTMALVHALSVPCVGVNHADFSADGRYFIASCEFSGQLLKVDTLRQRVVATLTLPGVQPMPQDVKVSPDGETWYVADMQTSGVWVIDGNQLRIRRFIPTGYGAHGLYISRDSRRLFITNRGEGSISVLDLATQKLVAKWRIPGGGSPDMGQLSPDGKVLWLSGRYNAVVYAIDTTSGRLLAKIPVGVEPHGLCVWPQPGRYSLGHTGILR